MKCDPFNCLVIGLSIVGSTTGLCAAGYWNLDKKIDSLMVYIIEAEHPRIVKTGG